MLGGNVGDVIGGLGINRIYRNGDSLFSEALRWFTSRSRLGHGHSSIRITADVYAHLQPAANIGFADMLDAAVTPRTSAIQPQTNVLARQKKRQTIGK
jgi:hypothetical protein